MNDMSYTDTITKTIFNVFTSEQIERSFTNGFADIIPIGPSGDRLAYTILDFAKLAAEMAAVEAAGHLIRRFEGDSAEVAFLLDYKAMVIARMAQRKEAANGQAQAN